MKKIESKTERIINKYKMKPKGNYRKIIMGGDEVGRGPLAGPVTVCVASIFKDSERDILKSLEKLAGRPYPIGKDSKKMTEKERVFWFKYLKVLQKEGSINFFINSKSAIEVDKKGIVVCINLILDEMVGKCLIFYKKLWSSQLQLNALFDAGLKTTHKVNSQKSIVKGDEKKFIISIASVYAKVVRDDHMVRLSKIAKYSRYQFNQHKGYGTFNHRKAIVKYGLSNEHRKSFCKSINARSQSTY